MDIDIHGVRQSPIPKDPRQWAQEVPKVKGKDYGLVFMPAPGIPPGSLSNENIANVLTYIRNEWGNTASAVSVEEVAAVREKVKDRPSTQMWTAAELKGGK